jgi:hypothetical protein
VLDELRRQRYVVKPTSSLHSLAQFSGFRVFRVRDDVEVDKSTLSDWTHVDLRDLPAALATAVDENRAEIVALLQLRAASRNG